MARICIIPARGGSKRIPKKNIRKFLGVPILSLTIDTLKESGLFDSIIVSSDSNEILELATLKGVDGLNRAVNLASDSTPIQDVVKNVLIEIGENLSNDQVVVVCFPCNPFLTSEIISESLQNYDGEMFWFPVVKYAHPIQRAFHMKEGDQRLIPNSPVQFEAPTQSFEPTYHDAGSFYVGTKELWCSEKKLHSFAKGILLDCPIIDIDNEEDWVLAELIIKGSRIES